MLRHRRKVGLFWLAVAVAGIALIGPLRAASPRPPRFRVAQFIKRPRHHAHVRQRWQRQSNGLVVTLPPGERLRAHGSCRAGGDLRHFERRSLSACGVLPAVDDARLVSRNGRAVLGLVYRQQRFSDVAQIALGCEQRAPTGVTVAATGLTALYNAPGSGGIGVLGEVALGAIRRNFSSSYWSYGSFLAVVPLVLAGVSILATFLLIGVITHFTTSVNWSSTSSPSSVSELR